MIPCPELKPYDPWHLTLAEFHFLYWKLGGIQIN